MSRALAPSEALCQAILTHVSQRDQSQPLDESLLEGLWSLLTSEASAALIQTAYEEVLRAAMQGRLAIDTERGVALSDFADLPFEEAVTFFKSKRIVSPDAFKRLDDDARRNAFTVAGLHQRYALERSHAVLADALERGVNQKDAVDALKAGFDDWGLTETNPYHLQTVFRTNVLGAYAEGRFEQASRLKQHRPFWRYRTVGDSRVRESHRAQEGKVYPADHPYWDHWTPPNGFNCRCAIETLSRTEVEEEGLSVLDALPPEEPDKGFAGSPRLKRRAEDKARTVQSQSEKFNVLRAPEVATKGKTPHRRAGDLGVCRSRKAAQVVDALAGVDARKAKALVESGEALVQAKPVSIGKREHVAELAIPSQHADAVLQMVQRIGSHPDTASLVPKIYARARLSPGLPPLEAAEAVGLDDLTRRSELVLSYRTREDAVAETLAELLLDAEQGAEAPIRHAPEAAQLTFFSPRAVRGAVKGNLARKTQNGRSVMRITKSPLAGHQNQPVFITESRYKQLDDA